MSRKDDKDREQTTVEQLKQASKALLKGIQELDFLHEYSWVYNPLEYASSPRNTYLERFGSGPKRVLFLGMNPGPWGMAQTGVPFGEINAVRDWMMIEESVGRPPAEHPKRPIHGFSCKKSEVSGRRLWGLMQERFGSPEAFFADHFVMNYCPLVFMEESGKNRTPDKLPAGQRKQIEALCDAYTLETIKILKPAFLVGIGGYAEKKFQSIVKNFSEELPWNPKISKILHPSPASPAANKGWPQAAESQMAVAGIWLD